MKDLNTVLQRPAHERFREIKEFVDDLQAQKKVKEFTQAWGLSI
jgi:hypothetical protein